jgi:hypothetical protein
MKRAVFLVTGLFWLAFAAGFALVLVGYLTGGAGLQELPLFFAVSDIGVSFGIIRVAGLFVLCTFCLLIGSALLLRGCESRDRQPTR